MIGTKSNRVKDKRLQGWLELNGTKGTRIGEEYGNAMRLETTETCTAKRWWL